MAKYGLTPQGPNPKRLDVILEDMHSKMTDRLGVNTRQNPQSLLNHILTNVADEIAELWEFGVDVYHSQYTSSATGVSWTMQHSLVAPPVKWRRNPITASSARVWTEQPFRQER